MFLISNMLSWTSGAFIDSCTLGAQNDVLAGSGPMLATIKRLQIPSAGLEMRLKKDHYTDCGAVSAATGALPHTNVFLSLPV